MHLRVCARPPARRPVSSAVPGLLRAAGGQGRAIVQPRTDSPHPLPARSPRREAGLHPARRPPTRGLHAVSPPTRLGKREGGGGVVLSGRPPGFPTLSRETSPVTIHSRSAWGQSWAGTQPPPFRDRVVSLSLPERTLPSAPESAGCRAEAQRPVEEKPRRRKGGGVRSSRQGEQQIAPSQWQRQDEVAPNSLRPMTRQSLQKPISISPGAGAEARAAAAETRCVCSIQFLRLQPSARLGSLSPPLSRPCDSPTVSQLCALCLLLAENKRGLRKYGTRSPTASCSL